MRGPPPAPGVMVTSGSRLGRCVETATPASNIEDFGIVLLACVGSPSASCVMVPSGSRLRRWGDEIVPPTATGSCPRAFPWNGHFANIEDFRNRPAPICAGCSRRRACWHFRIAIAPPHREELRPSDRHPALPGASPWNALATNIEDFEIALPAGSAAQPPSVAAWRSPLPHLHFGTSTARFWVAIFPSASCTTTRNL